MGRVDTGCISVYLDCHRPILVVQGLSPGGGKPGPFPRVHSTVGNR